MSFLIVAFKLHLVDCQVVSPTDWEPSDATIRLEQPFHRSTSCLSAQVLMPHPETGCRLLHVWAMLDSAVHSLTLWLLIFPGSLNLGLILDFLASFGLMPILSNWLICFKTIPLFYLAHRFPIASWRNQHWFPRYLFPLRTNFNRAWKRDCCHHYWKL